MSERLTLATSTGLPFLLLAFHVAAGMIALAAGFLGVAVRKGGALHRRSGLVFVYAMIAMGITATGIALYEGKEAFAGGVVTAYMEGVPAGMMFFMTTILLLAAIGDARMIGAGGIQGSRRIARHLWRMCFGLFIASGSFFLGQMKVIPEPIRIVPVLFVLALSPLVVLLYWMWRVRLKQNLRGLLTAKPVEARRPA